MTPIRFATALMLSLAPVMAAAADPQGKWFTPPPPGKTSTTTVDMTHPGDIEEVVVIAKRASRSWRTQADLGHLNDPLASDAARPRASFATEKPHCNSTLRTVGGQPGTAADMVSGSGAGSC